MCCFLSHFSSLKYSNPVDWIIKLWENIVDRVDCAVDLLFNVQVVNREKKAPRLKHFSLPGIHQGKCRNQTN